MRPVRASIGLSSLLVLAAGCQGTDLERSCGGEPVNRCDPYEHSVVRAASLEPPELPVADFAVDAHIRVELERCADAPAPHVVELFAVVPAPDGGPPSRVTSLLTLREGREGDPMEGDGVIDVRVPNPLLVTVPAASDILLRFVPRSLRPLGCTGEALELPYRTGPFRRE